MSKNNIIHIFVTILIICKCLQTKTYDQDSELVEAVGNNALPYRIVMAFSSISPLQYRLSVRNTEDGKKGFLKTLLNFS